jgi:hypothetical protein
MIIGSHTIIQSTDADADRAFLRDVLGLTGIDSGGGWLIFALPASELAIHPSSSNDVHEQYLICADVEAFVAQMQRHGASCSPISEQRWGRLTQVTLPGGGKLGVYEASHARPEAAATKSGAAKSGASRNGAKNTGARKSVKASKNTPRERGASKKPQRSAKKRSAKRGTKPAKAGQRRKNSRSRP